jgi:large subunit ribosomal protein L18
MKDRKKQRIKRHMRIRKKISGTSIRPRVSVFISNKHIYIQFIDDEKGHTLASVSSVGKNIKCNTEGARIIGKLAAEVATAKNIKCAVFDRGGFRFGARLSALVSGLEEGGIRIKGTRELIKEIAG